MPKGQLLFSVVFGSRKAVRAIFSEFDETKTKYLIFPGRFQNTEGESEAGSRGPTPYGGTGGPLAAPAYGEGAPWPLRLRLFAYKVPRDLKPRYQLTKLQKDSRGAAAIAKLQFGGQNLCSGTPPGRGIAPGVISIDTTAIFIAVADSHDEEGVVLPRG